MSIATATAGLDSLPRFMTNVNDDELATIRKLLQVWSSKSLRNSLRSEYYDMRRRLRPTGNIPPEALRRISAVLGWPEKAVTGLSDRVVFDGFVAANQDDDPFDLQQVLDANRFDVELPQAIVSAFKHSCAFITTTRGDVASGDPEVVVAARSAQWSAALWDRRRRRVSAFLAITDHAEGRPTAMDVYLPDVVLQAVRRPSGAWTATRRPSAHGEVLAEPLTWDPQLDRPFGRSRITRAVMNITDHALQTIVRAEIGADFFAVPRVIMLGLAQDAISKGKWDAAIDRFLAITRDEEGQIPQVQQMSQISMEPLSAQYRMYASQMAGETGLPISSLGIVQDNPPSAEALYAAEKDLIVKARQSTRVLGAALRQVARRIVRIRDGATADTSELSGIRANWLNPAFVSPAVAADALSKLAGIFPWLGDTDVALEYAGFTQSEVTRLLADKRRAAGGNAVDRALALARERQAAGSPTPPAIEASEVVEVVEG